MTLLSVLLEQIRTVNREDLREYIGTVDDDKLFRQINATLKKTFGLWVYKPEGKENIRCLCPKCLNDYIHNPDYIVRRLDPFAKRKDRCDKCDGDGWDYVVTDRYSSKKEKRASNDRKVPCFNHPEETTLPLRWLCQLPHCLLAAEERLKSLQRYRCIPVWVYPFFL